MMLPYQYTMSLVTHVCEKSQLGVKTYQTMYFRLHLFQCIDVKVNYDQNLITAMKRLKLSDAISCQGSLGNAMLLIGSSGS